MTSVQCHGAWAPPDGQTVVKLIWRKATSPPQTGSSTVFAMWRQCALPWGHIGPTWQIRLNFCFVRPT